MIIIIESTSINVKEKYVNLDNAQSWNLEKTESGYYDRIAIDFGGREELMDFKDEIKANIAFDKILQGIKNKELLIKL